MPPFTDNPNKPGEVSVQVLTNATEALSNILYLIEKHMDKPENIRVYLGLAEPVMASLKQHIAREYKAWSERKDEAHVP